MGLLRQDGKIYREKGKGILPNLPEILKNLREIGKSSCFLKKNVVYYRQFAARLEQRGRKPSFRLQTNLGKRDGILLC